MRRIQQWVILRRVLQQDLIPLTKESICIDDSVKLLISRLYLVCRIAVWMWLLPPPCDWQALLEVCVLSRPVELLVDLCWVAVYFCIVSWPSVEVLNFDVNPSCLLAGIHKLSNRAAWKEDMQSSEQSGADGTRNTSSVFRNYLLQSLIQFFEQITIDILWGFCVHSIKKCCPRLTVCRSNYVTLPCN